jgi:hypothetical protein
MTPPRRSRGPTVLAERHHGTSHVCPTMYHRIPQSTTHGTVWDNVGHVGSPKYIDNAMSPYGSLCSTHVIKFNTLLSLLKVFDFDLIVLPFVLSVHPRSISHSLINESQPLDQSTPALLLLAT